MRRFVRYLALLTLVASCVVAGCKKRRPETPATKAAKAGSRSQEKPAPQRGVAPSKEVSITAATPQAVAAYRKGLRLYVNARRAEAAEQMKRAVALDPKFARAIGHLGFLTPGAKGIALLEKAIRLSSKLPEPERLMIEVMRAQRNGEMDKVHARLGRVLELVPTDWIAQWRMGGLAFFSRNWVKAARHLRKAAELNPRAGAPHNLMGYAFAQQGKYDQAIGALKRYVALSPNQPNPHDSLGEILLMSGRYAKAETEFRKAASLAPKFWVAWMGVAFSRFYRKDWASGRRALRRARAIANELHDKLGLDIALARGFEAEGKPGRALQVLGRMEKEARKANDDGRWVWAAIHRSRTLYEMGKFAEALVQAELGFERAKTAKLSLGGRKALRFWGNIHRLKARLGVGKVEGARELLSVLEKHARTGRPNAFVTSALHLARGLVAMKRGGAKAALVHYAKCVSQDSYCQWQRAAAHQKLGQTPEAATVYKQLRGARHRDMSYLYVWSKMPTEV